jgi:cysteine desulfuration protein SufE
MLKRGARGSCIVMYSYTLRRRPASSRLHGAADPAPSASEPRRPIRRYPSGGTFEPGTVTEFPFWPVSRLTPLQLSTEPMPSLDTVIPRFKAADRTTRLETLLDYSRKLPPVPERLMHEATREYHRVNECQTPVFLWVEVEDNKVHIHADVPPESPTVRGFISLLARNLDGATPSDVARVPDDLLDQLGLSETLGMNRTQGLSAILHRIKRSVAAAA